MGVTPTGFVLKQYMSESDAINDTNALFVSQAVDGAITNFNQNDTDASTTNDSGETVFFNMFMFEKYWFR